VYQGAGWIQSDFGGLYCLFWSLIYLLAVFDACVLSLDVGHVADLDVVF